MIVNKAILIGRIGNDAEIRTINNGTGKALSFNLATDSGYRDKDTGEWVNRADWHRIVSYQTNFIDKIGSKLTKGRLIAIHGMIKTRDYEDKDGIKRSITEIVIDGRGEIKLLDKQKGEEDHPMANQDNDFDDQDQYNA